MLKHIKDMKNIHILPTDKPSRLYTINSIGKLDWSKDYLHQVDGGKNQNIYITSDENPKDKDYYWDENKKKIKRYIEKKEAYPNLIHRFKVILTTDQDLIKDGVQVIPDEFLEWFVKNPNCEFVEVIQDRMAPMYHDIIIPKEEPKKIFDLPIATNLGNALTGTMKSVSQHEGGIKQGKINLPSFKQEFLKQKRMSGAKTVNKILKESKQETLEETAEKYIKKQKYTSLEIDDKFFEAILFGAKWQAERMYSEEEVLRIIATFKSYLSFGDEVDETQWFEQFKKK